MTIAALVAAGPLRMGATGPAVKELQLALAAHSYPLHGTGYFGDNTVAAVKAEQIRLGLKPTGVVDVETAAALDRPAPIAAPVRLTDAPPWLHQALSCIGIAEVKGKGDNPVILAMARTCGGMIARSYKNDEIAWCKMFTEYCLVSTGFHGVDSLWALDNLKLGTSLKGAAVGAIACKKRVGGGHTFIIAGKDKAGRLVGIGGNQGDRVSRATFDPAEIVGFNWPNGYPLPSAVGIKALPIVDSAPLSKREA